MSLLKKFIIGVLLFGLVAFAAKEVFYSNKTSVAAKRDSKEFYYYPKLNTYYDVAANSFYYTLDGGTTWIIKKPATPDAPNSLGEKVSFYSQSVEVWKDNAMHIQQYGGIAVNYAQEDSIARTTAIADSIEKQTTSAAEATKEEPQVKGKFLKKLRQKIKKRLQEDKEDNNH